MKKIMILTALMLYTVHLFATEIKNNEYDHKEDIRSVVLLPVDNNMNGPDLALAGRHLERAGSWKSIQVFAPVVLGGLALLMADDNPDLALGLGAAAGVTFVISGIIVGSETSKAGQALRNGGN